MNLPLDVHEGPQVKRSTDLIDTALFSDLTPPPLETVCNFSEFIQNVFELFEPSQWSRIANGPLTTYHLDIGIGYLVIGHNTAFSYTHKADAFEARLIIQQFEGHKDSNVPFSQDPLTIWSEQGEKAQKLFSELKSRFDLQKTVEDAILSANDITQWSETSGYNDSSTEGIYCYKYECNYYQIIAKKIEPIDPSFDTDRSCVEFIDATGNYFIEGDFAEDLLDQIQGMFTTTAQVQRLLQTGNIFEWTCKSTERKICYSTILNDPIGKTELSVSKRKDQPCNIQIRKNGVLIQKITDNSLTSALETLDRNYIKYIDSPFGTVGEMLKEAVKSGVSWQKKPSPPNVTEGKDELYISNANGYGELLIGKIRRSGKEMYILKFYPDERYEQEDNVPEKLAKAAIKTYEHIFLKLVFDKLKDRFF